jgi:DNA-binding transcriptional LysR family regulator
VALDRWVPPRHPGGGRIAAGEAGVQQRGAEQAARELAGETGGSTPARGLPAAVTLHQLRLFWTLAHARSLTGAAKQLGISQPALSQALGKLERLLGTRLVERRASRLALTEAGRFLLERTGRLLAEADALEAGLAGFRAGRRGRVAVGALASLARTLLPAAFARARAALPELALEVHELAPQEAVEALYGRTLELALVSETAVARDHLPFARVPVCADGYALAVPPDLVLDGIDEPERRLRAADRALLARTIEFNFGTLHGERVADWYRRVLPEARTLATVRTYETALAMVEAGLGVALVPLLTAQLERRRLFEVRLYAVPGLERRVVALVPGHRRGLEPVRTVLEALVAAGRDLQLLTPLPPPPFLVARGEAPAPP